MFENITIYSEMRKIFRENYAKKIVPSVQKYEKSRKFRLFLVIFVSFSFFLAACCVLLISYFSNKNNYKDFEILSILFSASLLFWVCVKKTFENTVKKQIMPLVCKCFGNMKWSEGSYSDSNLFVSSLLIPKFTEEIYDDVFKGQYKDVNIEIVESEYIVGSGRYRNVVFDGVIIKLDMNKSFTGHTIIKPHGIINVSPSSKLHHIELEDVKFNKEFNVFSNDDVDSRYLITPSFMERFQKIKNVFGANSVSCVFYENFLIIALKTKKDLFSICSLTKPVDDREQYFQMFDEILSIIKLIDHFKLDKKIGL